MAKKSNELKQPLENATTEKPTKRGGLVATASIDIRTKGGYYPYLEWSFGRMPKEYSTEIKQTETGYQVKVQFKENAEGRFFIMRFMAAVVAEIRTLDECNLKIGTEVVTTNRVVEETEAETE